MNDIKNTNNQNSIMIIPNSYVKPVKFVFESSQKINIKDDGTFEIIRKMTLEELMREYDIYFDTEFYSFTLIEKEYEE